MGRLFTEPLHLEETFKKWPSFLFLHYTAGLTLDPGLWLSVSMTLALQTTNEHFLFLIYSLRQSKTGGGNQADEEEDRTGSQRSLDFGFYWKTKRKWRQEFSTKEYTWPDYHKIKYLRVSKLYLILVFLSPLHLRWSVG